MVPAVILSVVAFVAGKPVQVTCDETLNGHARTGSLGWAAFGGNTVYVIPRICDNASRPLGDERFAQALSTLIHEAAHARGYRREACAEMIADVGVYQVLRDYYRVPFFSSTSVLVGRQVRDGTRQLSSDYQIESCWASDPS